MYLKENFYKEFKFLQELYIKIIRIRIFNPEFKIII
jgi:hypothetical protein